jgi:phospholipase/carboxylesterase
MKFFNTSLGRFLHEEIKLKLRQIIFLIIGGCILSMLIACQSNQPTKKEVQTMSITESTIPPLPERAGPRPKTTGTVPHTQIGIELVPEVNDELFRRAYALPGVQNRPTIVSLPGGRGMWLDDSIPVIHPEAIVAGRELAHIHTDGSLHAPLPFDRALKVAETGWGERHPWADQRDGWDGLVMLYTPQSMVELDITFQLIVESYNYVTGQNVQAATFYLPASESSDTD